MGISSLCSSPDGSCNNPITQDAFLKPSHIHNSSSWLYLKVFYVRLCNCEFDKAAPEHLTVNHILLSTDTILEVNGNSSSTSNEYISSTLRRDRVDKKSEQVIFVSTDNIRMTGSIKIEVYASDNLFLSGVLELSKINGCNSKWSIKCQPVISNGSCFLKERQSAIPDVTLPTIELYVAGWFSGSAIILTKTLHLSMNKKNSIMFARDSVPENDEIGLVRKVLPKGAQQLKEYEGFFPENGMDFEHMSIWRRTECMEVDDWFNAGVRVGVGIGLSIFLGIGIGAGFFLRTYRSHH